VPVADEGRLMQIPKEQILEQHAGLLEKLGIDPGDLAGSLGGVGNKLGL
jgi:hypothetical protein